MKGKKILVTGGAGFIGSHLCFKLITENNKVYCIDNLITGSLKNIEKLIPHPNFIFINHDITEPLPYIEVDYVFNLACPASPIAYQKDAIKTIKTSTLGVINILEFSRKNNARVLQASTSEVYGDPKEHPQKESYWGNVNPIGVRSCYDEGKRVAECLFMDYHRMYNLDIKIIRIFNTYGPNMAKDDGRVVSNFINQALENNDITIYGNGNQTRSFQYIDDLINAIILMMVKNDFIGPVNLGNPDEFTIKELAKEIIKQTNSKSKLIYQELPEDDPVRRKPNIFLASKELRWKPKINIKKGLKETIKYFKDITKE